MVEIHPYPTFKIDGTALQNVNGFKCLGSVTSSNGSLDIDITERMNKASEALGRL